MGFSGSMVDVEVKWIGQVATVSIINYSGSVERFYLSGHVGEDQVITIAGNDTFRQAYTSPLLTLTIRSGDQEDGAILYESHRVEVP